MVMVMYDENRKFTKLIKFMAENYYSNNSELNEAVSAFEDAIETSGNGKLHLVWQEKTGRELRSPSHHIHTRMHSSTLRMIMDSKLHSWSASGIIHLKN